MCAAIAIGYSESTRQSASFDPLNVPNRRFVVTQFPHLIRYTSGEIIVDLHNRLTYRLAVFFPMCALSVRFFQALIRKKGPRRSEVTPYCPQRVSPVTHLPTSQLPLGLSPRNFFLWDSFALVLLSTQSIDPGINISNLHGPISPISQILDIMAFLHNHSFYSLAEFSGVSPL